MEFKEDTNGYMYLYCPDHYCSNKAGKVYEHVKVMSDYIGRKLYENECVHHIDRDKRNNDISNLRLMTIREHTILHLIEDYGVEFVTNTCKYCKSNFETTKKDIREYCSSFCASESRCKFVVSPEELEFLVWTYPTVKVSEILGVSDKAVSKRCKKYNISKPPRGYWSKVKAGLV